MRIPFIVLLILISDSAEARGVYEAPEQFVSGAFQKNPPPAAVLWLTDEIGPAYLKIMGEAPRQLRLRYWRREKRSVWVLDAIGKEEPVTAGFVVDDGRVSEAKVLIFRESRGAEIRHPFFTRQFQDATLTSDYRLSNPIDGVSGATLSVDAMRKMAALALYLDQHTSSAP